MEKALVFLADGFEEIEALTVVDLLRRAEIVVSMVSINSELNVKGAHGIIVIADEIFNIEKICEADALILPGGSPGTANLKSHNGLKEVIHSFNEQQKIIAAICAAPSILGEMGILKGKKAVCYPGYEQNLLEANVSDDKFSKDGNILTSRSVGTAIDFSFKLIEMLKDKETANRIKKSIAL